MQAHEEFFMTYVCFTLVLACLCVECIDDSLELYVWYLLFIFS